jgi:hypothetical protein
MRGKRSKCARWRHCRKWRINFEESASRCSARATVTLRSFGRGEIRSAKADRRNPINLPFPFEKLCKDKLRLRLCSHVFCITRFEERKSEQGADSPPSFLICHLHALYCVTTLKKSSNTSSKTPLKGIALNPSSAITRTTRIVLLPVVPTARLRLTSTSCLSL